MNALMTEVLAQWWARQGGDDEQRARHSLEDWIEIGAMDPPEGARWIERLRAGEHEDGAFVDQLADAARARVERAFAVAPERIEAGSDAHLRLAGVLTALHLLSTVPVEESVAWYTDLGRRLIPAPPDPELERRERERSAVGAPQSRELLRVLPGPPKRRAGLRIVSVEIYDDSLVVQWHSVGDVDPWPRRGSFAEGTVAVSDDRGTTYISCGGGGGLLGGLEEGRPGRAVRGHDTFAPAPPPGTTRLTIEYEHEHFTVAV